jgi:hypothetical protein
VSQLKLTIRVVLFDERIEFMREIGMLEKIGHVETENL